MTVLVTGASGFIGRHVVAELLRRSEKVRVARRPGSAGQFPSNSVEAVNVPDSATQPQDWEDAVADCSAVIHLAARAHAMGDRSSDPACAFHRANVEYARTCALAAAQAGVQRFIFMSSIGVHGGASGAQPIHVDSPIAPHTLYAQSKADAEMALAEILASSGTALTILRPPLVYGPQAPGNFGALVRAVARGWPLPLGAITENRRSLIAVDNLVNLLMLCLHHPAARDRAFLVSDGEDLSTATLLKRVASAMGRSPRLFPVPQKLLELGATLAGKQEVFQRLCGSLQVDISATRELLEWTPPLSVDEGLRKSVGDLRC